MKIQQSATPYIILLAAILIGIPLTDHHLTSKEDNMALEVQVEAPAMNIAKAEVQKEVEHFEE